MEGEEKGGRDGREGGGKGRGGEGEVKGEGRGGKGKEGGRFDPHIFFTLRRPCIQ